MVVRRFCRKGSIFKCFLGFIIFTVLWLGASYLFTFNDEDFPDDLVYDVFIDETLDEHPHSPLDQEMRDEVARRRGQQNYGSIFSEDPTDPIVLWWTEFTLEPGKARTCDDKICFFTNNKAFRGHKNMRAFMFYGTDFESRNLPLPREQHHEWALFHEESPKNNHLLHHQDALSLFNHTCTFRRESDFPITTQALLSMKWLESSSYTKTTSQKNRFEEEDDLAPVIFVQSDCDTPSDRDTYVQQLMKHIKVDSYGRCLHNKDLPESINKPIEGMFHQDFYELVSRYKFAVAIENAVCEDYITEKFWRPLMVGTVPIVFGSPSVKDFFPDKNSSALSIVDFPSVEALAEKIKTLDKKDAEYDKYRQWKVTGATNSELHKIVGERTWTPNDPTSYIWSWGSSVNYVEAFECHVCKQVHKNIEAEKSGRNHKQFAHWANVNHYGCPKPLSFDERGRYVKKRSHMDSWSSLWEGGKIGAKALRECVEKRLSDCGSYRLKGVGHPDF